MQTQGQLAERRTLRQFRKVSRAATRKNHKERDQHEHRSRKRVQKELIGRVNAVFPAPDTDDQEHGNQHGFKEEIKEEEIERREGADHKAL